MVGNGFMQNILSSTTLFLKQMTVENGGPAMKKSGKYKMNTQL